MGETYKHLGVPGPTIICVDTELMTAACLCSFISPWGVYNLVNNNATQIIIERELLQACGKAWTHQTQTDTKSLTVAFLSCPVADPFQPSESATQQGEHYTLFGRDPYILTQLGSQLHTFWTKLVVKYMEGLFPFCLEGWS
jgi:hypothetical protein